MNYNVWNKWDPLKTVVLGTTYHPDFYKDIKNTRIRSCLQRIAKETLEDLAGFERVLNNFGCTVLRTKVDPDDSIMNYISNEGKFIGERNGVPKAPLEPRNCQFVGGNKLYITLSEPDVQQTLIDYNSKDIIDLRTGDWRNVHGPNFTVLGKDIYVDQFDCKLLDWQIESLHANFPDLRLNLLNIGGHNDAVFAPIGPGRILSLKEIQHYKDTFPNWEVCYLPNQSWQKVAKFAKLLDKNMGKWWLPGEEENDEFTHFVETWLHDWVGYVEETVFDVNCLVLDEHHVCVSQKDNPIVNDFFAKHNIKTVYVPWRHRYFWDGGLHCITLDLEREGTQQDLFPERTHPVQDRGFE